MRYVLPWSPRTRKLIYEAVNQEEHTDGIDVKLRRVRRNKTRLGGVAEQSWADKALKAFRREHDGLRYRRSIRDPVLAMCLVGAPDEFNAEAVDNRHWGASRRDRCK
jgi:hypothetical protein